MQFIAETVAVLGGQKLFKRPVRSANDLDRAVAEGLPAASATHTLGAITPAGAAIRADPLIPSSTFKRRVKAGHLSPDESDKVVRLAHLVAVARYVLGEGGIVNRFFQAPHPELDGRKPADAALTAVGARQVEDILWRIFHGLPA